MLFANYRMNLADESLEKKLSVMLNLLVIGIWTVTIVMACLELRKRFRKTMFASAIVNAIGLGTEICFSIFVPDDVAFQIGDLLVASVARQVHYVSATSEAQVLPITTALPTSTPPPPPPDSSTAAPAPMNSVFVTSTCCSTEMSNKVHEEIGKAMDLASANGTVEITEMDDVMIGQHIQNRNSTSFQQFKIQIQRFRYKQWHKWKCREA